MWHWIVSHEDILGGFSTLAAGTIVLFNESLKSHKWFIPTVVTLTFLGGFLTLVAGLSTTHSQEAFQTTLKESQKQILDNATTINTRVQGASTALGELQGSLNDEKQAVTTLTTTVINTTRGTTDETDSFIAEIPFVQSGFGYGVPFDRNINDPLVLTYSQLATTARAPTNLDRDAQVSYLEHLIQFFVLHSIFDAQHPPTLTSYSSQKGLTTEAAPAIDIPDKASYSRDALLNLSATLPLEYGLEYSPSGRFDSQVELPRGSQLHLIGATESKAGSYAVVLSRRPEYELVISVEQEGLPSRNVLPPHFARMNQEALQPIVTYSFKVTMHFKWHGDKDKGNEYAKWARGLFSAMKKRLAVQE